MDSETPSLEPSSAHPTPSEASIDHEPNVAEPRGVLKLLGQIKAERLAPASISVEERRQCVMHLSAEGLSVPEIAGLLQTSDRTIARDRQAIRKAQALEPDTKLIGLVAGRLVNEADTCVARIRRVTRDKDAPHAARIDGERVVFEIVDRLTHRLQSLGLLPSAVQRVEASLTHRLGTEISLAEIQAEAARLADIEQQSSESGTVMGTSGGEDGGDA